jgi:hypothetical protein
LWNQVVETTRLDRLHGICAPFRFYDMCSGHQLPPNHPKIDKTDPTIRASVVIHSYNFDKTPFDGRDDQSVNRSF